jgi:hypothetical protein
MSRSDATRIDGGQTKQANLPLPKQSISSVALLMMRTPEDKCSGGC